MSAVTIGGTAGVGGAVGGTTALTSGDPSAVHVATGALAFTGFAVGLYLVVAVSLIVVGFCINRYGAYSLKRAKRSEPPT